MEKFKVYDPFLIHVEWKFKSLGLLPNRIISCIHSFTFVFYFFLFLFYLTLTFIIDIIFFFLPLYPCFFFISMPLEKSYSAVDYYTNKITKNKFYRCNISLFSLFNFASSFLHLFLYYLYFWRPFLFYIIFLSFYFNFSFCWCFPFDFVFL